jgi:ABC-type sugar transport system ATPase subunit
MLTLKNISNFIPDGAIGIRNLNLEVKPGEFLVLTGPKNCGKTRLLKLIAGVDKPRDGEILIGKERCEGLAANKRAVATIFQNYALYPGMTAAKNIIFGMKFKGFSDEESLKMARDTAEKLGIGGLLKTPAAELSPEESGMVVFARALVLKPKILLIDGFLENFDGEAKENMRRKIMDACAKFNITTIYASPGISDAKKFGSARIALLKDGVIQQVAYFSEIYENPANMFAAEFITGGETNFIGARLEYAVGEAKLRFNKNEIKFPVERIMAKNLPEKFAKNVIIGAPARCVHYGTDFISENPDTSISAELSKVEELPGETRVEFKYGQFDVIFLIAAAFPETKKKTKMRLALDPSKISVFDRETQYNIFAPIGVA